MGLVSKGYTFSAGAVIIASEHNSNFDTIYSCVNGNLSNANISNSAAIAYSKLTLTGSILNADINASAAIAYSKLNLTGAVLNADLAGSIADSKLSTISTAGKVSGSALTSLASIPAGAGLIPSANIGLSNIRFSAYKSSDQSTISNTKITFDTEDFDTGSNFASSTFTVPTTGVYLFTISGRAKHSSAVAAVLECQIYVNGSIFGVLGGCYTETDSDEVIFSGSIILSLTATNTVEIYGVQTKGTGSYTIIGGATRTRFTGSLLN